MSHSSCLPDLVIGGSHKCGTSSVFYGLARHPGIVGAEPKETFFFIDAEHPLRSPDANLPEHGVDAYQRYFPSRDKDPRLWLDATTHYLYSETAIEAFRNGPKPKLVAFFLREPAARIYSSYQYTANNLGRVKAHVTFDGYVEKLLSGQVGDLRGDITDAGSYYVLKRELEYSRYADYLIKWRSAIGEERMAVYLFEDFVRRPVDILREIAARLELDVSFYDDFRLDKANETVVIRNRSLHNRLSRLKSLMPSVIQSSVLKEWYLKLQRSTNKPAQKKPESLKPLRAYYTDANQQLADEFNIDTGIWNHA